MTPFPTIAELLRRPEFQRMSRFLRSVRPDHPVFPGFPPLAFRTLALQEDDSEYGWLPAHDSNQFSAKPGPDKSSGAAAKLAIAAEPLEIMACLWMLSLAVDERGQPMGRDAGFRCLTLPESAAIDPEVLKSALHFVLQPDPEAKPSNASQHVPEISVFDVSRLLTKSNAAQSNAALWGRLRSALVTGSHVFLCRSGDAGELPADLSAFQLQNLTLPPVSREQLYALHCLAHPTQPRLKPEDLPKDDDVETLSVQLGALAVSIAHQKPVHQTLQAVLTQSRPSAGAEPAALTLDGLIGNHNLVALGRQIAQDRAAWKRGELDWAELPNGVFLHGPPGCGKTLFAQALAGTLGVELFMLSYADAIKRSSQNGADGRSILSQLTAIAEQAQETGNAVVFLDEIDAIGRTRFAKRDHNSTYYGTLTASVLRICDDLRACPGVILIAATNQRDEIDPAILRPGRFDHKIALSPPDLNDIAALLSRELPGISGADIVPVARNLVGCSFAELTAVAKHSRALARSAQRDIALEDLTDAVAQLFPAALTDDADPDLWRAAVHEAGHALMLHLLMKQVPRQIRLQAGGEGQVIYNSPRLYTSARLHDVIGMLLGGRAAELVVLGELSSGSGEGLGSDLQRATYVALCAENNWHIRPDSELVWQHVPTTLSAQLSSALRARISDLLRTQQNLALSLLSQHKPALLDLAQAILRHRELDRAQTAEIFSRHAGLGPVPPVLELSGPKPGPKATDVVRESEIGT